MTSGFCSPSTSPSCLTDDRPRLDTPVPRGGNTRASDMSNSATHPGHYRGILTAIQAGRLDEAADDCRTAIARQPADGRAWFLLAAVHNRMGDFQASLEHLRMAATNAHGDRRLMREIIDALLTMRAFGDAQRILESADLSDPLLMLALARCRWGEGAYQQSLGTMAELWKLYPGAPEIALHYARALISLDAPDSAEEVLDQALAKQPGERELAALRARVTLSQRGTQAALAWIRARYPAGPDDNLGVLARALADIDRGEVTQFRPVNEKLAYEWEGFAALSKLQPAHWTGDNAALLKHALSTAPADGVIAECGVFHGKSINLLAKWAPRREIHGFDSFAGLPGSWARNPTGAYSTGGRIPDVRDNVRLHPGWFEDTLPGFASALVQPIALLYIDCDIYSSTVAVLEHLGPELAPGAIIVFDEIVGYSGWRDREYRAWMEYQAQSESSWEAVAAIPLGQILAVRIRG